MTLDVLTPRGQQSRAEEELMLSAIRRMYPGWSIHETPKDRPADVDGIIEAGGEIKAVCENKCRNMTVEALRGRFGNEWLVSFDKISKAAAICRSLQVPMVGYLFLVPSNLILSIRLVNEHGEIIAPMRLDRTATQATTNGGSAVRTNAYVHMGSAKEIRV